jgi:hypothetical protein
VGLACDDAATTCKEYKNPVRLLFLETAANDWLKNRQSSASSSMSGMFLMELAIGSTNPYIARFA